MVRGAYWPQLLQMPLVDHLSVLAGPLVAQKALRGAGGSAGAGSTGEGTAACGERREGGREGGREMSIYPAPLFGLVLAAVVMPRGLPPFL